LVAFAATVALSQVKKTQPKPTPTPTPKFKTITGGGCSHVQAFEYDRVTYQNTVNDTDFVKIPKWKPERGEPAMSFGKAARIARKYLQSLKLDDEPKRLESVTIYRFCGENWVYGITFAHEGPEKVVTIAPGEQRVLGRYFYLFVRPDGIAIKPAERSRLKTID
jgi:hypothetical protein